jgi:23S rRNA (guanosine2251-2'-O)-methyltransferase
VSTIEGRNAVREALRGGVPVKRLLIAEGLRPDDGVDEIVRLARQAGVPVANVPRREIDTVSERGAHQGVIAEVAPFSFAPLEQVVRSTADQPRALVVALDHVTDPGNLGAIVRTAEVAGAAAVLVPQRRSAAVTPAAYKAAAGAFAHLPVVQETNLVRALGKLKDAGFWVAGADCRAEQTAWEAPLDGKLVLVMGGEGEGLSRLAREACDFLVRLPQAGEVDSLNVAQAAAVLMYEWVRRADSRG